LVEGGLLGNSDSIHLSNFDIEKIDELSERHFSKFGGGWFHDSITLPQFFEKSRKIYIKKRKRFKLPLSIIHKPKMFQ
jgi:hypothetical protein